jgi:hypothetical protein
VPDQPGAADDDPVDASSTAPSALPSVLARALAFAAIVVAGLCGGLIGFAVADLQCTGDCTVPTAIAALAGAVIAGGGVAVIAVLVLRAMSEWRAQAPLERR